MKKITETDLLNLGFKKETVFPEESGDDHVYDYFTFDINNETVLISTSSDECIDNGYSIEFFEIPEIGKFQNLDNLTVLIAVLSSAKR